MRLLPRSAGFATAAWVASNLAAERAFRRALTEPARAQEAVLREIIEANASSAFGREHGFAQIRGVADFQRAVPPRDYDAHAPWVARAAAGEAGVLTTEPITHFEPSSGSTAAAKLLPSTARLRAHFQRGVAPWVVDLYRRTPKAMGGPSYWSISPRIQRPPTEGGVPVGFAEDSAYLGGVGQRLVDVAMAVPGGVADIQELRQWRYATLLFLLRAEDLALISVWNPSFLTLLVEPLAKWWDTLLSDLFTGAHLGPVELPAAARRAEALSAIDPSALTAIWPKLSLISCWTDAHAQAGLGPLRAAFPGVPIQPKGLLATEAVVSIPYGGAHPAALRSAFLELESEGGVLRKLDEWEVGEVGSVVVTTAGGLYRYRLRDRVEVTGRLHGAPCLRFLGKEDRVSDRCGEKLDEAFVAGVLERLGLSKGFAMLAPQDGPPPGYALFTDQPAALDLGQALQDALNENPHYRWACELGQLKPARVIRVHGDGAAAYIEACRRRGQRLGDIKPCVLSPLSGWSRALPVAPPEPTP